MVTGIRTVGAAVAARPGQWGGTDPHDRLEVDGEIGTCGGFAPLQHGKPEHQVRKDAAVRQRLCRGLPRPGPAGGLLDLLFVRPGGSAAAFSQAGFLDGWQGLSIAWMTAFYTFLKY